MHQSLNNSIEDDREKVSALVIALSVSNMFGRLLAGQALDSQFKAHQHHLTLTPTLIGIPIQGAP